MTRPAQQTNPMRLKLANDHGELDTLARWLGDFASGHGLSGKSAFGLELVLTEAVTNIMDHARRADAAIEIELACALRDDRIEAEVADNGAPFDPSAQAPAQLAGSLDEATPGGLGIHLMRRYATRMDYRRERGRNILSLTLPAESVPVSC